MSSVILYYDPVESDRLCEDAVAARFCPRPCTFSTAAKQTPRHRDVYRPRLDIHASKDTNTVTATFELPGLTPDRVTIEMQQDRLTVSGDRSQSLAKAGAYDAAAAADSRQGSQDRRDGVRERLHFDGRFSRTLRVPVGTKVSGVHSSVLVSRYGSAHAVWDVRPGDVKAKMEHGVLTITFPRVSPDQPPTRIVIQ